MSRTTSIKKAAGFAAAFLFMGCAAAPRYSLDLPYGESGYLVLHVAPDFDGAADREYGLRRNDMYVSSATAANVGSWMAFWGDDPPAFTRPGATRVLKDPWLARVRGGRWQVTRVPHEIDGAAGAKLALVEIRRGADGDPRLVYGTAAAPVTREPSGWRTVRRVRFLPLPAPPDGLP